MYLNEKHTPQGDVINYKGNSTLLFTRFFQFL